MWFSRLWEAEYLHHSSEIQLYGFQPHYKTKEHFQEWGYLQSVGLKPARAAYACKQILIK